MYNLRSWDVQVTLDASQCIEMVQARWRSSGFCYGEQVHNFQKNKNKQSKICFVCLFFNVLLDLSDHNSETCV